MSHEQCEMGLFFSSERSPGFRPLHVAHDSMFRHSFADYCGYPSSLPPLLVNASWQALGDDQEVSRQWHSFSDHCHSFKEVPFTPVWNASPMLS